MIRPLRVMSYNIRHGRGADRRVDIGRIAEVIASFDPDVVGLQEVDIGRPRSGAIDQPSELALRLEMNASFALCMEIGSEQYGVATLTRLPLLDARRITLPKHHRRSEPRCALVTRLQWPDADGSLVVLNTHLSTLSRERPAQIAMIACEVEADELILLGDFNCTPRSKPFRRLCRHLENATRAARTWPARLPIFPIDHILFRGPLSVVQAGTWRPKLARMASDHLPVFAELAYLEGTA